MSVKHGSRDLLTSTINLVIIFQIQIAQMEDVQYAMARVNALHVQEEVKKVIIIDIQI